MDKNYYIQIKKIINNLITQFENVKFKTIQLRSQMISFISIDDDIYDFKSLEDAVSSMNSAEHTINCELLPMIDDKIMIK